MASLVKRGKKWTATARLPDTFQGAAKSKSFSQTFPNKRDAKLWLESTESAMRLGTWRDPRLEVKTFGPKGWPERKLSEALDAYRETETHQKKGASQESAMLRMLARTEMAKKRLRDVDVDDVVAFRDARLSAGKAPSTVRNNLNTLSAVFRWLIHEQKADTLVNPMAVLRGYKRGVPQPGDGRERRLLKGEEEAIDAVLAEMPGPVGRQWRALFPLLLDTGMRLGEALSIRCGWLRLEYGFVVIPDKNSKNNTRRYVAISDRAYAHLLYLAEGEDDDSSLWRFSAWTAKNVWRNEIRVAAGCLDLRIHDLRHEALSRMAARGADLKTLMRQSGHKTVAVLMRYLNPTPQEQRAALFPETPPSEAA